MAQKAARLFALGLVCAAAPAFGVDWSFKAFGTLGAIGTDADRLGFRRDISQNHGVTRNVGVGIDSRLGMQVDADFSREFHAAVQWVARNHVGDFVEQNLDWAFLRWRPREDLDLRLGRLGTDAFLLSDYRNVGYAYPWMRPPTEFYGFLTPYHFDGADVAKKFAVGDDYLTVKGYVGYSRATDVLTQQSSGTVVTKVDALQFGGNLVYESNDWRARISYVQLRPVNDFTMLPFLDQLKNPLVLALWPGARVASDAASTNGKPVHFSSLGIAYDDGVWPIHAEASYITSAIDWIPDIVAGYLSLGRRVGALTFYSLYGVAESMHKYRAIPAPVAPFQPLLDLASAADSLVNGADIDQMSLSGGLRWDVHGNIALKAEWSHYWLGGNGGNPYWQHYGTPQSAQVNVWSFGADFVF
jgi:hypothetical protein